MAERRYICAEEFHTACGSSDCVMAGRREKREGGGFAARLREVIGIYGSASALAKAIERSEGAVRKWLRGESEPNVTDLRCVCEATRTSVEWLVTGRGEREALALGVREAASAYENATHKPLDYALLEAGIAAGDEAMRRPGLAPPSTKRSMLPVTLYYTVPERKR